MTSKILFWLSPIGAPASYVCSNSTPFLSNQIVTCLWCSPPTEVHDFRLRSGQGAFSLQTPKNNKLFLHGRFPASLPTQIITFSNRYRTLFPMIRKLTQMGVNEERLKPRIIKVCNYCHSDPMKLFGPFWPRRSPSRNPKRPGFPPSLVRDGSSYPPHSFPEAPVLGCHPPP